MLWHDLHLPTFKRAWRAVTHWWRGLDRFEHGLLHVSAFLLVIGVVYWAVFAPPPFFPAGAYVQVPTGASLSDVAALMQSRGIVSYALVLKSAARMLGSDKHIAAGEYYFGQPTNAIEVAIRLVSGDFQTTPIKVTVPEGTTVNDIADILFKRVPSFDKRAFLNATQGQEGYLFPDTYFFMPGEDTSNILAVFQNNLRVHVSKLQPQIDKSGKSLLEVLTMASIVEKEAPSTHDRQVIAGILWHRIAIGMPLQVDVTFPYFLNKSANDLTTADLSADSPYNTFLHEGLPPGPVDNPSLDSITAAITPIKTSYLYYLSDRQGNMHYATTYTQFLAFKHEYLGG